MSGGDAKSKGQTSGFQRRREGHRSEGCFVITSILIQSGTIVAGLTPDSRPTVRKRRRKGGDIAMLGIEPVSTRRWNRVVFPASWITAGR